MSRPARPPSLACGGVDGGHRSASSGSVPLRGQWSARPRRRVAMTTGPSVRAGAAVAAFRDGGLAELAGEVVGEGGRASGGRTGASWQRRRARRSSTLTERSMSNDVKPLSRRTRRRTVDDASTVAQRRHRVRGGLGLGQARLRLRGLRAPGGLVRGRGGEAPLTPAQRADAVVLVEVGRLSSTRTSRELRGPAPSGRWSPGRAPRTAGRRRPPRRASPHVREPRPDLVRDGVPRPRARRAPGRPAARASARGPARGGRGRHGRPPRRAGAGRAQGHAGSPTGAAEPSVIVITSNRKGVRANGKLGMPAARAGRRPARWRSVDAGDRSVPRRAPGRRAAGRRSDVLAAAHPAAVAAPGRRRRRRPPSRRTASARSAATTASRWASSSRPNCRVYATRSSVAPRGSLHQAIRSPA